MYEALFLKSSRAGLGLVLPFFCHMGALGLI
jgi:hypothetical protein